MEFIREAGWGIYPVLAFGLAALIVAARQIGAPRAGRTTTAGLLMALTLAAGGLGTATGLKTSASHIHEVAFAEKWIFLVGLSESLNNMVAALVLITLALLALLFAHLRHDAAPALASSAAARRDERKGDDAHTRAVA